MKSIVAIAGSAAAPEGAGQPPAVREYRMPAKLFHWLTVALVVFMVASGVLATQIGDGGVADLLYGLHKLTGAITLTVVLLRLGYRLARPTPPPQVKLRSRPILHWTLYGIIVLVPLLGWAGVSAGGGRDIFFGCSLPPIWPEGTGHDTLLLHFHAYVAFGLLALVALHIGIAMQDYMTEGPEPPER